MNSHRSCFSWNRAAAVNCSSGQSERSSLKKSGSVDSLLECQMNANSPGINISISLTEAAPESEKCETNDTVSSFSKLLAPSNSLGLPLNLNENQRNKSGGFGSLSPSHSKITRSMSGTISFSLEACECSNEATDFVLS